MEILKEILQEINQAKIDSSRNGIRTGDYRIGLTKAEQIINSKLEGQTFSLDGVSRCVLSDKDQAERKMLIDLQQDEDRWFSEDEFNRLLELNKKAFENHKALHGG